MFTMKKILYLTLVAIMVVATPSCRKYLDQVPDDILSLEETFANQGTTFQFLSNMYNNIPNEYGQRNPGGDQNAGLWTGATDEGEYLWGFVQSNDYNIGSWDANSGFVGDFWRNYYRGIRSASIFLKSLREDALDMTPQLAQNYRGEARALRAMFYFYLMRLYGPVILLGDEEIPADAPLEDIRLPRSTFDECVQYVLSELDLAIPNLATSHDAANAGRITKSIAEAFKAQTLFLAASPLFNGNTDLANLKNEDGTNLINQTYDAGKWTAAANAYKSFITQYVPGTYRLYRVNGPGGTYDPYLSTRNAIIDPWNYEGILIRPNSSIGARQYELTPYHAGYPSQVKGSGGLGATQNIVDAFFMANGKSINDAGSGYVTSGFSDYKLPYDDQPRSIYNQWVNREPRFYTNITFHGSVWLNRNYGPIVSQFNYSGNSGRSQGNDYSPTGYVVRKGMTLGQWDIGGRPDVLYRLANVFLDYAEALNEANPGNPDILNYLNQIRDRAGIPLYGSADIPVPADQAAMREAIRKERRVELAFENVRFFDVRRWKIGHIVDNGPIYGLSIQENMPNFLNVTPFENRVFSQRHYLFPIPQSDVNTNNLLVQNPGW
jgi:hypothetical protein